MLSASSAFAYVHSHARAHASNMHTQVRWMPPEALMDGVFTTATDVWSFGVLLWEVMTFAKLPYGILTNAQVCEQVCEDDYRLPQPKDTPADFYAVTGACWAEEPKGRKTFDELLTILSGIGLSLGPIRHKKDPKRSPSDWAPQVSGGGGGAGGDGGAGTAGTGVVVSGAVVGTGVISSGGGGVADDEYISIGEGGGSSGYESDDSFDGFSKLLSPDGEVNASYYKAADVGDADEVELYEDTRHAGKTGGWGGGREGGEK